MTHLGGDLQNNLKTLSGLSSEMSVNTWWFMFFAWSLKSSVPFSGYVNTERDQEKQEFYESSFMSPCFGNMLERRSFIYSLHHSFSSVSPRLSPSSAIQLACPVPSVALCAPYRVRTALSAHPHPCPRLRASTHPPALLGLIWQISSQEQKPCHSSMLNVFNRLLRGWQGR